MKKMFLVTLALVLMAIPAFGQGEYLGLFADPVGENCAIFDNGTGPLKVYVVHMDSPGATAVEFMVDFGGVPDLFRTEDTQVDGFITLGNSLTGVSIGYGACLVSPIVVLELNFFGTGVTSPCSELRLLPHPDHPEDIQIVDCGTLLLPVEGRGMFINPDATCTDCAGVPVATEIDTWGSLKSLYR
jgi:hypothetical protein